MSGSEKADLFERWVPPRLALTEVANRCGDWDVARAAIVRRLTSGLLGAMAEAVIWEGAPALKNEEFYKIPKALWDRIPVDDRSHLWTSGEVDFLLQDRDRYHELYEENPTCQLFGVRFDPEALGKISPKVTVQQFDLSARVIPGSAAPDLLQQDGELALSEPRPKVRRQDLPLLPESIFEAWHAWFVSTNPNASQDAAVKSAALFFPNHNYNRERVRELFKGNGRGRPSKNS